MAQLSSSRLRSWAICITSYRYQCKYKCIFPGTTEFTKIGAADKKVMSAQIWSDLRSLWCRWPRLENQDVRGIHDPCRNRKKAIIVTALHDTEGSALPHNVSLPVRIIFILHSIALVHEVHLPQEATCVVELFCVRLTPERLNTDDKGALAIECWTYTQLVSPAEGLKKKKMEVLTTQAQNHCRASYWLVLSVIMLCTTI